MFRLGNGIRRYFEYPRHLLRFDGAAGLSAGTTVLLLSGWLSELYGLPRWLVVANGFVNLVFGSYSTALAARKVRAPVLVLLLVFANLSWAVACAAFAVTVLGSAEPLGVVHALIEALFVGSLGALEWRNRRVLVA